MANIDYGPQFWQWVTTLGRWYFNRSMAQRQVRLHWPAVAEFASSENEFLKVLRQWAPLRSPIDVACELSQRWYPRSHDVAPSWAIPSLPESGQSMFPPYLPYLVAFAMAWEMEGDYAPNAYYSRLNEILGRTRDPIETAEFQRADSLWRGLEHWANVINDGELGLFTAASLGGMIHVGYPLSQVVLSPSERNRLQVVFTREGLMPDMALEDADIRRMLLNYLNHFSSRVQRALGQANSRFLRALYEEIRIELANSDPAQLRTFGTRRGQPGGPRIHQVRLRLACKVGLHEVVRWFFATLSEPEDLYEVTRAPYTLRPGQVDGVLWQTTADGDTPNPLEFMEFAPLGQELRLSVGDSNTILWPSHRLRFFSPSDDMNGVFVEQEFLPDSGPLLVLACDDQSDSLKAVADANLPGPIWPATSLYRFGSPEPLCELFPQRKSYSRKTSPIHLFGGVRCQPHEPVFFSFALPRVIAADGWAISCSANKVSLVPVSDQDGFRIEAEEETVPSAIAIEARKDDGRRRQRIIQVEANPVPTLPLRSEPHPAYHDGVSREAENRPLWPAELGHQDLDRASSVSLQLWEVMATWGQCSYARFAQAVAELFQSDEVQAWRVASGMQALGHIAIAASPTNGEWREVLISPAELRRLPWDMEFAGTRIAQAVLVGQIHWALVRRVLNNLPGDVEFDVTPQPQKWLPPKVRLWSSDPERLHAIASEMGVAYFEHHGEEEHDGFVAGLIDGDTPWLEGVMSPGQDVSYFSPLLLRDVVPDEAQFERLKMLSGGSLLATQMQSYGARHYYLVDTESNRRTRLGQGDRQTARWRCYMAAGREFFEKTGRFRGRHGVRHDGREEPSAPYLSSVGHLILPFALFPPGMIAKMLVGCTGLMPEWCNDVAVVESVCALDAPSIESFESPFLIPKGTSLVLFRNVPRVIADSACKALGISLCDLHSGDPDEFTQ